MAVRLRLSRIGKKGHPFYRIVATDSRVQRDGECLENLGTFDPAKGEVVQFHAEKINKWIGVGAQCSDSVKKIIKMQAKKSRQEASV